jgi:putative ATPase
MARCRPPFVRPDHCRCRFTSAKDLGYGKDYKYAHNYQDAFVAQDYLPEELKGRSFYAPTGRGYEKIVKQRLDKWKNLRNRPKQDSEENETK